MIYLTVYCIFVIVTDDELAMQEAKPAPDMMCNISAFTSIVGAIKKYTQSNIIVIWNNISRFCICNVPQQQTYNIGYTLDSQRQLYHALEPLLLTDIS